MDTTILLKLSDQSRTAAVQVLAKDEYLIMTRENMLEILSDMGKDASCMEGQCEVEVGTKCWGGPDRDRRHFEDGLDVCAHLETLRHHQWGTAEQSRRGRRRSLPTEKQDLMTNLECSSKRDWGYLVVQHPVLQ